MTARTLTLAALLPAALLIGCAHDNDRLTLGNRTPDETVKLDTITSGPGITKATGPSITSTDRANWEPIAIVSPPEAVDTCPHLTQLQPQYSSTPQRAGGVHPTADSALTLDDNRNAGVEGLSGVAWSAWDIIMMIPRAIVPTLRSPESTYQRYTQPALTPDVAPPAAAAASAPAPAAQIK